jgi:hypothetical protein
MPAFYQLFVDGRGVVQVQNVVELAPNLICKTIITQTGFARLHVDAYPLAVVGVGKTLGKYVYFLQ